MINNKFRPPQHVHIAKSVGIEIILAAKQNQAIPRAPPFRHLNASSGVSAKAVVIIEAGLLDKSAQSVLAVCEVGGSKKVVGSGDETCRWTSG